MVKVKMFSVYYDAENDRILIPDGCGRNPNLFSCIEQRKNDAGEYVTVDRANCRAIYLMNLQDITDCKYMWISFYMQDGTQAGESLFAKDIDDAEQQLKEKYADFGGIADYGVYQEV